MGAGNSGHSGDDDAPARDAFSTPPPRSERTPICASSGTDLIPQRKMERMPLIFRGDCPSPQSVHRWRLLCYGDSLTVGYCDEGHSFEPYGRSLARALAKSNVLCDVSVIGLSGLTAREMVERLDDPNIDDVADCVGQGLSLALGEGQQQNLAIIMAGTNDLARYDTSENIAASVWRLHAACHEKGVPTVALTIPPAKWSSEGSDLAERQQVADLIASRAQHSQIASGVGCLAVVDPGELVPYSCDSSFWEVDGLHYSQSGSQELGLRLAPRILALRDLVADTRTDP